MCFVYLDYILKIVFDVLLNWLNVTENVFWNLEKTNSTLSTTTKKTTKCKTNSKTQKGGEEHKAAMETGWSRAPFSWAKSPNGAFVGCSTSFGPMGAMPFQKHI